MLSTAGVMQASGPLLVLCQEEISQGSRTITRGRRVYLRLDLLDDPLSQVEMPGLASNHQGRLPVRVLSVEQKFDHADFGNAVCKVGLVVGIEGCVLVDRRGGSLGGGRSTAGGDHG